MDLTIDQASLARALKLAARVAPVRASFPILQHVLLTAEAGRLTAAACDLEVASITTLAAAVASPGQIAVGARILADYVSQLPPSSLRLALDGAQGRLKATCERSAAQFALGEPADFPVLPGAVAGGLDLDAAALGSAL